MLEDVAGGDYKPFWVGFPLTDIHKCIAPDILHQLYQGVLKHLVYWVQHVMGKKELDERIQKLPPTSGVRHFSKGISGLSQLSGTEHKNIARILLGCLVGKIDPRGITACRAILHFIQLAQYSSHDQDTLQYMKQELDTWYSHCDYFIHEGARENFDLPKFHSLLHYVDSIRWIGTTDNSNTEAFECLHIDFAKEVWRASNKKDHFRQMITFLSRQEKVSSYDFYQSWIQKSEDDIPGEDEEDVPLSQRSSENSSNSSTLISIAKNPSVRQKKLSTIALLHNAPGFSGTLKLFLNDLLPRDEQLSKANTMAQILPFLSLDVWHSFKLTPLRVLEEDPEKVSIKSQPFPDTVLVLETDKAQSTAVRGWITYQKYLAVADNILS
ncbi:hypothetical protein C8R42DRAFT_593757 [Lentinula raphanica]|nr:hypothetical protein C8R42DRAFT_593757 [Lentinula raphanica]